MRLAIISASPNKEGLTASCVMKAIEGAKNLDHETVHFDLNQMEVNLCQACKNGWGICRSEHECIIDDDFNKIKKDLSLVDAFVIITPVYWWDMSESMKAFLDRLRRCEASKSWDNQVSILKDKPIIAIAAAGGSGNGVVPCLANMERFIDHVKGIKFDFISITKRSRDYKLEAISKATGEMLCSLL
jgi:multimeric flavodoxin WrbA